MCQLSSIRQFIAQGMHQHIGGGMQEQPELVGGRFVTTGTAGFQTVFVVFDEEFCITPVAINLLVEIFGPGLFERSDDVAGIKIAEIIDIDPADYTAGTFPSAGGVISGCIDTTDLAQILILEFCLFEGKFELTVKRPVGTESNDEFDVVRFTPRMNRRFAVVAVGTKNQDRIGKAVADLPDNSFEQRQNLPPSGSCRIGSWW